jgi:hypothetical protein
MADTVTKIKLSSGAVILLKSTELPDEIMSDRILFTDYSNLAAEMATMPVLLNKIGLKLAECENDARMAELRLKRWKSNRREQARKETIKSKGKFTVDQVDDAVRIDPQYVVLNTLWISAQKQRDDMNSLFWSLKSKQSILENLSKSMAVGDYEDSMIRTSVNRLNYVDINIRKPLIQ